MKIALFVILVFFMFGSCTKINLAEYRKNPGIDLRFCYTTNARIGRERPSLFPQPVPAINVWERIRRQELEEEERAGLVAVTRRPRRNPIVKIILHEHDSTRGKPGPSGHRSL